LRRAAPSFCQDSAQNGRKPLCKVLLPGARPDIRHSTESHTLQGILPVPSPGQTTAYMRPLFQKSHQTPVSAAPFPMCWESACSAAVSKGYTSLFSSPQIPSDPARKLSSRPVLLPEEESIHSAHPPLHLPPRQGSETHTIPISRLFQIHG